MTKAFKPALFLFATVSGLWLVLSGHYTFEHPLLILLGLASCVGVVALCRAMGILDPEIAPFHKIAAAGVYIPWLIVEIVKSSLDVAWRVLHPGKPKISPRVIQVKASQLTDLGRVTYANSITLTPGTLTIEAEDDVLTVHALSREGAEELERGEMDRRVSRAEGLL